VPDCLIAMHCVQSTSVQQVTAAACPDAQVVSVQQSVTHRVLIVRIVRCQTCGLVGAQADTRLVQDVSALHFNSSEA
jgi:hypothetical protein